VRVELQMTEGEGQTWPVYLANSEDFRTVPDSASDFGMWSAFEFAPDKITSTWAVRSNA
jgi:hypothetical protein